MTIIPESLSFVILAGFPPLVGLYNAFIMSLVLAIFSGRSGLISGGCGCHRARSDRKDEIHGLEHVFGAVAFAAVL